MNEGLSAQEFKSLQDKLLCTVPLYNWSELRNNRRLLPRSPGVYGWFFKRIPADVPTESCFTRGEATLLYVGISPHNEKSKATLQSRLRLHFKGTAESSTLRQTLGCLLEKNLGTVLRRNCPGSKTFGEKESALSQWMADNAMVAWLEMQKPWTFEEYLLKSVSLPLNINGNDHHPFCTELKKRRKNALQRATKMG